MGYCCTMTRAGYELQAKLFAQGGDFEITRVMVGEGALPPDADPSRLTGLVAPVALATSTIPVRRGCEVSFTVEYRSDLNGGLERPFQICEFGVFAMGAEGEEALILYGDLGDMPDAAVPLEYGGCVRRYPIVVTMGPDAEARLDYPAGAWMTAEDTHELFEGTLRPELEAALADLIAAHNADPEAHHGLQALYAGLGCRVSLLELMFGTDVSGNPFLATFESLTGLKVEGVWNADLGRVEF